MQFLGIVASGLCVFVLPGALLVRATGAAIPSGELPAWAMAGSLAALYACFGIVVAAGFPLHAAVGPLIAVSLLAAAVAFARSPRRSPDNAAHGEGTQSTAQSRDGDRPRWWPYLVALLVVAAALAAAQFASVGSIDRWWYLAYVRGYLQGDVLSTAEPFLGTGHTFARFGVHPWLMGLALWSNLCGADPVWLYERAAPVLAVTAAVSAALALSRALFGGSAVARAAVVATVLMWSGALLPVLARAGEDKVLAQAALFGLCIAAGLHALQGRRGALGLAALAAIATATTHGLTFALVLLAWLPLVAWRALVSPRGVGGEPRALVATTALLLVIAVQPAASGLRIERDLAAAGAIAGAIDHPVLRVHDSRERTIDAGSFGFVVHPRLLAHPLSLLALGALPLLLRRRRSVGEDFLLVSTAAALAIAFVPPLPALTGKVIPAWMVYRVLWILPLAPLAAFAAEALRRRLHVGEAAMLAVLCAISAPVLLWSVGQRVSETRAARAVPASIDFAEAMQAVAALPRDALVAASPELSERIPALCGRRVVAGLDRSTIVFSGSRDRGEARLALRAATLAGDPRAAELAAQATVQPTHALFDPHAPAQPSCGERLPSGDRYALCALTAAPARDDAIPLQPVATAQRSRDRATTWVSVRNGETAGCVAPAGDSRCAACCTQARRDDVVAASHPGDWDAATPLVDCRIECPSAAEASAATIVAVEIVPVVGRAVDELLLQARASQHGREIYVATARARTEGSTPLRFELPHAGSADRIELRVVSGLLPFVKLRDVAWEVIAGPEPEVRPGQGAGRQ